MAEDRADGAPKLAKIGYLPTLDGWRAIAIGLVFLEHGQYSLDAATGGASRALLRDYPDIGLFGVRIFFGISGFLICSRLIEEDATRGRISLKDFYIRRAFRILPPLLAMMLFLQVLTAFGVIHVPLDRWLAGLSFFANYLKVSDFNWYVEHLWSLSVEEQFYLVLPALLTVIGMARGFRFSYAAAIGVAVWRFVALKSGLSRPNFDGGYFWYRTDILADGLLWGCAAAFLHASPLRERLRSIMTPAVTGLLCLCLLASPALHPFISGYKTHVSLFSLQALAIPLALVATVMQSDSLTGRILESRPLRWIGRLSYSLYLWQQLFLVRPSSAAMRFGSLQQFPINFVMPLVFAVCSYYLLELPMMRLGHRVARPATAGRAELAEPDEEPEPRPSNIEWTESVEVA